MAQSTQGAHAILSHPRVYWLSQVVLGSPRRHANFVEHVGPEPGMRILDMGCGPGELLRLMPGTDYLGFDLNPTYIDAARKRFGDLGEFRCADVTTADFEGRRFDVVTAHGLLHHLDDEQADRLMALAASVLDEGGRLLTADTAIVDGTARFSRWLIEHDRGKDMRTPEGYAELGRRRFADVEVSFENQRILPPLIPWRYPMAVIECRRPL
ncbi:MAG: class I SAM-dependent methyltransferase [Solirubrobacterales bacterium]